MSRHCATRRSAPRLEHVGRYRLVQLLRWNESEELYVGFDPALERGVTIELATIDWDSTSVARATRARELARLNHCSVPKFFDAGEHEGRVFWVTEWIAGEPLDSWLEHAGPSWRLQVRAFVQAARALEHAHQRAVYHRNFSTEKVLIGADDRVVVTEFEGSSRVRCRGAEEDRLAFFASLRAALTRLSARRSGAIPQPLRALADLSRRAIDRFAHMREIADSLESAMHTLARD